MSASGHSRHSWRGSKLTFVRFTPLATVLGMGPKGRDVPIATDAPQQTVYLFDHLVGEREQRLTQKNPGK
jgi:hypothetical protein